MGSLIDQPPPSSQTTGGIPVIDFSRAGDLKPGASSWASVRDRVRKALEEYGCFVLAHDLLSLEPYNRIFDATKEFFDLPVETKRKNVHSVFNYGYVGEQTGGHLRESMMIDDAPMIEQIQNFVRLNWPQGNDKICETLHSYGNLIEELEQVVKRMVFESLGAEKYLEPHAKAMTYHLRLMKYRGPKTDESNVGVRAHTDPSLLTFLHINEVGGLEIQMKGTGEWIESNPSSSSFLVMVGRGFTAWSNGIIHSPVHRVMMSSGGQTRYSLATFSYTKELVEVPKEFVDEQRPLLYPQPFNNLDLRHSYVKTRASDFVDIEKPPNA